MIGRDVQHLEIAEVVLDLRSLVDHEPELPEDLGDLADGGRDGMERAAPDGSPGRRDVDGLGGELPLQGLLAEADAALRQGRLDRHADGVRDRADLGPIVGRQRADAAQDAGQPTLLAEDVEVDRLEAGHAVARGDRRQGLVAQVLEFAGQVGKVHELPSCVTLPRITSPRSSLDVEGSVEAVIGVGVGRQALLASSAIWPNTAASRIARSARILRSISTSAFFRPLMN